MRAVAHTFWRHTSNFGNKVEGVIAELAWKPYYLRRGADKTLTWLTSRCRRTGSIVSLERHYRITRLFLLQRLKGSISGEAPNFRDLQPRRNRPTWASNVLITHPILRIGPRRTATCSLDWKTIEKSPFFIRRGGHCCRGDLVGRKMSEFFWLA